MFLKKFLTAILDQLENGKYFFYSFDWSNESSEVSMLPLECMDSITLQNKYGLQMDLRVYPTYLEIYVISETRFFVSLCYSTMFCNNPDKRVFAQVCSSTSHPSKPSVSLRTVPIFAVQYCSGLCWLFGFINYYVYES